MEGSKKQFRKRNAILACLRHTDTHPGAEEIHRMLHAEHPDISLATVYRNLSLFKKQGLIRSLGTVNGIERFDANTQEQVHFICTGCDAVIDLPGITVAPSLGRPAEESAGVKIHSCQLSFTGLCGNCLKKEIKI